MPEHSLLVTPTSVLHHHLFNGSGIVIGEHLQGNLVLLLTPPNLVIQLGVMESQATVNSKGPKRLLVLLQWDG